MTTVSEVEAVLDPILARLGFAAGQDGGSGPDDSGDIIWCAAFADVHTCFPWLTQVSTQFDPTGYECFDLRVSLILGRIVEVDLEGVSLAELVRLCGTAADAAEAASLLNTPAETASVGLVAVLTRLFESVSTPTQRLGT